MASLQRSHIRRAASSASPSPRSQRRPHVIPFGHPYSCTPVLSTIFETNQSPSHSEVTRIMSRTGLKRKQITSWFWRKRKELKDLETTSQFSGDSRSPSHPLAASADQRQPKTTRPPRSEDDEYHPPISIKIHPKRNANTASFLYSTRSASASLPSAGRGAGGDQYAQVDGSLPADRDPGACSASRSRHALPHPPALHTDQAMGAKIKKSPLLIRCKLKPLAQRPPTPSSETDDQQTSDPQDVESAEISHETSELLATYRLEETQSSGIFGLRIKCDPEEQLTFSTYPWRSSLQPSQTPSLNTDSSPKSSSEVFAIGQLDKRASEDHIFEPAQVENCPEEPLAPSARRLGSKQTSLLGLNRCPSRPADTCEPSSPPPSRTTSSRLSNKSDQSLLAVADSVGLVASQASEYSNSGASLASLGNEIYRVSELSDIEAWSRDSSQSLESHTSSQSDESIVDYSALLATSAGHEELLLSKPGTPNDLFPVPSVPKAIEEEDEDRLLQNYSTIWMGAGEEHWVLSEPTTPRPVEKMTRKMSGKGGEEEAGRVRSTLLGHSEEVEVNPRLFLWEDSYHAHELYDWQNLARLANFL